MCHNARFNAAQRGFTMIELMIVLAVLSILAFIAFPAYQDSVRKARRADAAAGLMRLQQLQERHRGQQPAYASTVASMPGPPPAVSPDGLYALTVEAASASSYKMLATAQASTGQYGDVNCRSLRVTMTNGTLTYSSVNAAGVEDTTNANRCWAR
jgi:type IV pilus assembly protein PilE